MRTRSVFFYFFLFYLLSIKAQHQDKVDFIRANVDIDVMAGEGAIKGKVSYQFKTLRKLDSFFLDAQNMTVSTGLLNKKKERFRNNGQILTVNKRLRENSTPT